MGKNDADMTSARNWCGGFLTKQKRNISLQIVNILLQESFIKREARTASLRVGVGAVLGVEPGAAGSGSCDL